MIWYILGGGVIGACFGFGLGYFLTQPEFPPTRTERNSVEKTFIGVITVVCAPIGVCLGILLNTNP